VRKQVVDRLRRGRRPSIVRGNGGFRSARLLLLPDAPVSVRALLSVDATFLPQLFRNDVDLLIGSIDFQLGCLWWLSSPPVTPGR
jgi:hypothetical protein